MKKMMMCAVFVMGLGLAALADTPTVTSVTAQQRYPWNGLVDIVVTISGEESDVAKAECTFAATDNATKSAITIAHITQVGSDMGSGSTWTRRFIWDSSADISEVKINDVKLDAEVKAVYKPSGSDGVQLWENGPYWAECNVGASKPEECGYYFQWGDTVGHTQGGGWFTSEMCPTHGKNDDALLSLGYINSSMFGKLTAAHDAATTHFGVPWRMPTLDEVSDLADKCDAQWVLRDGVRGRLVKGKGAYSSKSIFLPAAGFGLTSGIANVGSEGNYWTSSPHGDSFPYDAWVLRIRSNYCHRSDFPRYFGLSIRPVRGVSK